jgi:hypothetical protein
MESKISASPYGALLTNHRSLSEGVPTSPLSLWERARVRANSANCQPVIPSSRHAVERRCP